MNKKYAVIGGVAAGVLVVWGTVALADSAKPGDPLFGLDKRIEKIRLTLAGKEDNKLKLKIQIAGERKTELREINPQNKDAVEQSLEELRHLVTELGHDINDDRIKIEAKQDAGVTKQELGKISDDFTALLHGSRASLSRIKSDSRDNEVRGKIQELEAEVENELEVENNEVELGGILQTNQITVNGRTFTITGAINLAPFNGRTIKVEGALAGDVLTVQELRLGGIKIEVEDGIPEARFENTVVQGTGVSLEGINFTLTGSLANQLAQFAGRTVRIRGPISGTAINLERIRTQDQGVKVELRVKDDGGLEIRREDKKGPENEKKGPKNEGGSGDDRNQGSGGNSSGSGSGGSDNSSSDDKGSSSGSGGSSSGSGSSRGGGSDSSKDKQEKD